MKPQIIIGILLVLSAIVLPLGTFRDDMRLFFVTSSSMNPALGVFDIIVVKRASAYAVGDVLTFKPPVISRFVTHRIVSISLSNQGLIQYKTRGDANPAPDPFWIQAPDVVGKTIFVIKSSVIALFLCFLLFLRLVVFLRRYRRHQT